MGLLNYADLAEMALLDHAHQQFHSQAERTIKFLRRGRLLQAEEAYGAVQIASRDLLYLLSRIESKCRDSASIRCTQSFVQ